MTRQEQEQAELVERELVELQEGRSVFGIPMGLFSFAASYVMIYVGVIVALLYRASK